MKLSAGEYYGKVEQSVNINGLILSRSHYRSKSSIPLHYHQNPYFCFVLNGNYAEHAFRDDLNCIKGDVIFHPQHTEHHNNFSHNSATCFNLEFSDKWSERFMESKLNLDTIIKTNNYQIQSSVLKIYKELNEFDNHSSLMIEGLMLETIVGFSRTTSKKTSVRFWLKKVTDYLSQQYNSNPSLTDLAKIAGVSPEHLVREFRKVFKITIGEYMRELKVKQSCHLLTNTNKDLSEITFELGFSDQSHFNRVFKKIMGLTPLEYRLAK